MVTNNIPPNNIIIVDDYVMDAAVVSTIMDPYRTQKNLHPAPAWGGDYNNIINNNNYSG